LGGLYFVARSFASGLHTALTERFLKPYEHPLFALEGGGLEFCPYVYTAFAERFLDINVGHRLESLCYKNPHLDVAQVLQPVL
jgi:hypothetical protein